MRTGFDQLDDDGEERILVPVLRDVDRLLENTLCLEGAGADGAPSGARGARVRGIRHFVPPSEGSGYYDFFKLSEWLYISITDVSYVQDKWVWLGEDGSFKIRLLLSGTLLTPSREILARSPQLSLSIVASKSTEGYFIRPGENLRMVVLHCRPELLSHGIGLGPDEIPRPFDRLFETEVRPLELQFGLTQGLMTAANKVVESRHGIYATMRGPYLNALSFEIVIQVVNECLARASPAADVGSASRKDANRIAEAQAYIIQNHHRPLTIANLARLVGINQTKFKSVFRTITGETVFGFIMRYRMERSLALLAEGRRSVAEIGYAVGYGYPANFATAFRRFYGVSPTNYPLKEGAGGLGPPPN